MRERRVRKEAVSREEDDPRGTTGDEGDARDAHLLPRMRDEEAACDRESVVASSNPVADDSCHVSVSHVSRVSRVPCFLTLLRDSKLASHERESVRNPYKKEGE